MFASTKEKFKLDVSRWRINESISATWAHGFMISGEIQREQYNLPRRSKIESLCNTGPNLDTSDHHQQSGAWAHDKKSRVLTK